MERHEILACLDTQYKIKIIGLLEVLRDRLSGRDFPLGQICDASTWVDTYAWGFAVNDCALVQIAILERLLPENGINFRLAFFDMGGKRVFSKFIPHWVDENDPAAVEQKWAEFAQMVQTEMGEIVSVIVAKVGG